MCREEYVVLSPDRVLPEFLMLVNVHNADISSSAALLRTSEQPVHPTVTTTTNRWSEGDLPLVLSKPPPSLNSPNTAVAKLRDLLLESAWLWRVGFGMRLMQNEIDFRLKLGLGIGGPVGERGIVSVVPISSVINEHMDLVWSASFPVTATLAEQEESVVKGRHRYALIQKQTLALAIETTFEEYYDAQKKFIREFVRTIKSEVAMEGAKTSKSSAAVQPRN